MHDIAGWPDGTQTGTMERLDEFISLVRDSGHEIEQELDPDCIPMRCGELIKSMDDLVN